MNLAALGSGRENDSPDEGVGQAFDASAIEVGKVRMNVGHVGRRLRKAGCDFRLLALKVIHARFHRRLAHAVLDSRDDPVDGLLGLSKCLPVGLRLCATVAVQPVHFLRIGFHSLGNRFAGDKPLFQAGQHAGLDLVAGDGPAIVTGATPMMVEAGIAVRRDNADLAAAAPAGEKAGKEMNRTVRQMHTLHAAFQHVGGVRPEDFRYLLLAGTRGIPQFIIHDAQVRNLLIHALSGLMRDTRFPMDGSLINRRRFQASTPA